MSNRLATVVRDGKVISPPPAESARARRHRLNPSRKARKVARKERHVKTRAAMTAAKQAKEDEQRRVRLKRSQAAAKKKADAELAKAKTTPNGTEPNKVAVVEVKS